MPTYNVSNDSFRDKAIKVHGGSVVVKAGKSATIDTLKEFSDDKIEHYAGLWVVIKLAEKPKMDKPKMSKPGPKLTKG